MHELRVSKRHMSDFVQKPIYFTRTKISQCKQNHHFRLNWWAAFLSPSIFFPFFFVISMYVRVHVHVWCIYNVICMVYSLKNIVKLDVTLRDTRKTFFFSYMSTQCCFFLFNFVFIFFRSFFTFFFGLFSA